jgi:hypothetical protein
VTIIRDGERTLLDAGEEVSLAALGKPSHLLQHD